MPYKVLRAVSWIWECIWTICIWVVGVVAAVICYAIIAFECKRKNMSLNEFFEGWDNE